MCTDTQTFSCLISYPMQHKQKPPVGSISVFYPSHTAPPPRQPCLVVLISAALCPLVAQEADSLSVWSVCAGLCEGLSDTHQTLLNSPQQKPHIENVTIMADFLWGDIKQPELWSIFVRVVTLNVGGNWNRSATLALKQSPNESNDQR